MIWLGIGVAVAGFCVGWGPGEIALALSEGFKLLAATEERD